jgi:hypothetical protein
MVQIDWFRSGPQQGEAQGYLIGDECAAEGVE